MQERVTQDRVEGWVEDLGFQHQSLGDNPDFDWGMRVSRQRFPTIVVQPRVAATAWSFKPTSQSLTNTNSSCALWTTMLGSLSYLTCPSRCTGGRLITSLNSKPTPRGPRQISLSG